MNAREFLDRVVSLLFPPRCVICREITGYDDTLCGKCTYDADTDDVAAKVSRSGAAGALAVMAYDSRAAKALVDYKRYGDKRATAFFCGEIYGQIKDKWVGVEFDITVPVPMSKKSRGERGFNQAELLARGLADLTGSVLRKDMLLRVNGSLPQHKLGRDERAENAARSYISGNMAGIEGKNILLVDDIITTGATICACTGILLNAGAAAVYAAAVASSE